MSHKCKGHVADGNMGFDPPVLKVINGTHLERMLVDTCKRRWNTAPRESGAEVKMAE